MFDVSFSELMLIGIIALVVIGPQRLPKVARTIGHLVGRAQRYVSDVKTDIQREIDLDELNKVKSQMESAAQSVKSTVGDLGSSLTKPVEEARKAVQDASSSLQSSLDLNPLASDKPAAETAASPATTTANATDPASALSSSSSSSTAPVADIATQHSTAPVGTTTQSDIAGQAASAGDAAAEQPAPAPQPAVNETPAAQPTKGTPT